MHFLRVCINTYITHVSSTVYLHYICDAICGTFVRVHALAGLLRGVNNLEDTANTFNCENIDYFTILLSICCLSVVTIVAKYLCVRAY